MTEELRPDSRCVLRLFGAPPEQLSGAVERLAPQWQAAAQWKSRGGETLLALCAKTPAGLKKAERSLRAAMPAALYGAGDTTLAAATVEALENHGRLLVCGDAAAGALLEPRLENVAGAEKVFDFGALSYANAKTAAQIEKRASAKLRGDDIDVVRLAVARANAARRIVGAEIAAACAERTDDCVLVLRTKKGCWLRIVPATDSPGLWLLDMIRRAACSLPQASGTGFLPTRSASASDPAAEAKPDTVRPARRRWPRVLLTVLVLAALALAAAWWYTGGDLTALPGFPGSASSPRPGATFM